MNNISGEKLIPYLTPDILKSSVGEEITINACVNKIKKVSGFSFVYLRTGNLIIQAIHIPDKCRDTLSDIFPGVYVRATGVVKNEPRADYGIEITLTSIMPLSFPKEKYPLNVSDKTLSATLELNLEHRSVALRHPDKKAVFRIREGIIRGFRDFMLRESFTEINTPKITGMVSENPSTAFPIRYFDSDAYLAQSPQFYKQSAVAFFDRVFEVGPVFYSGKHNSARHLCEYTSLDFEMGFIETVDDIMHMLTAAVKSILETVKRYYGTELSLLGASVPELDTIPVIPFDEAMKTLDKDYPQRDLDPTDEARLCDGTDFMFVTQIPKQPFYNKESFVLLFKGMEIARGGQRIHDYDEQLAKLSDESDEFLKLHRYGVPPHGGCGIGLERFVMQLLGLENIREASLFPRDMHHCGM